MRHVCERGCCEAQVQKSAKQAVQRKAAKAGGAAAAADAAPAADVPKRWSDYTVHFHFPEPTGLSPLLRVYF